MYFLSKVFAGPEGANFSTARGCGRCFRFKFTTRGGTACCSQAPESSESKVCCSPIAKQGVADAFVNTTWVSQQMFGCRHQLTYKVAAISASLGITAVAVAAVHYRFAWHIENGGEVPLTEALCTFLLVGGGVVSPQTPVRLLALAVMTFCVKPFFQKEALMVHTSAGTCRWAWRCGHAGPTRPSGTNLLLAGHYTKATTCLVLAHLRPMTSLLSSMLFLPSGCALTDF